MKAKITLDTVASARNFCDLMQQIDVPVYVTDSQGLRVNAKSLLGMLYCLEFAELYCECEKDIYHIIFPFLNLD